MPLSVVSADPHLQLPVDSWDTEAGPSRAVEAALLLAEMAQSGRGAGAEEMFILGDVFHLPNPTSYIRTMFNSFLMQAREIGIQRIVLLPGNHDMLKSGAHSLAPTKVVLPWVIVVDQPSICDRFVYAPHAYFETPEEEEKYWSYIRENSKGRYLLGHLQLEGAKTGVEEFLLGGAPLTLSKMPECRGAMLGHIHKPQEVSKGIHYVGSSRCMDIGERADAKRYLLVDFDTGSMQSMIPQNALRYLQYDLKDGEIEVQDWSEAKGCIVKVKIHAKQSLPTQDIRKALLEAGAAHINSVRVLVENELVEKSEGPALSPMDAVRLCLEGHEQREVLIEMAGEILKAASA